MGNPRGRYSVIAIALLLAVALSVAACGASSDTATTKAASSEATTATTAAGSATTAPALESGSIMVSGAVDYPMEFTSIDMDYMDWVTVKADHPTSGSASYDGVHLSEVWEFLGVQSEATTVVVTDSSGSTATLTLADISSDALLAVAEDESFSLVMPGMDAKAWVEDVVAMEFK